MLLITIAQGPCRCPLVLAGRQVRLQKSGFHQVGLSLIAAGLGRLHASGSNPVLALRNHKPIQGKEETSHEHSYSLHILRRYMHHYFTNLCYRTQCDNLGKEVSVRGKRGDLQGVSCAGCR
jgi:hypothetical protein